MKRDGSIAMCVSCGGSWPGDRLLCDCPSLTIEYADGDFTMGPIRPLFVPEPEADRAARLAQPQPPRCLHPVAERLRDAMNARTVCGGCGMWLDDIGQLGLLVRPFHR